MNIDGVTLKISLSPRDHQYIKHLLPHQLSVWYNQVNEVLIVFDLHGYNTVGYQDIIKDIELFVNTLKHDYPVINLVQVDYSPEARKAVSKAYFGSKRVPLKTHRYGPYYSYFYGIYKARYNYILNTDCDMFFGGHNPNWTKQAIELMQDDDTIITCSPYPGPPRKDGKLMDQAGEMDDSALKKTIFKSFSTRIFFINKQLFIKNLCPLPIRTAQFTTILKAIIRGNPIYMLPEDVITAIMVNKGLIRIDFLGSNDGIWSLHPPFRNHQFFRDLHKLLTDIETNNIPDAQRGYYDINDSMINWEDARAQIKNGSIKLKILNFFKPKN
jgi:hypothetical protein